MGVEDKRPMDAGYEQFLVTMRRENLLSEMLNLLSSIPASDPLKKAIVRGVIDRVFARMWGQKKLSQADFDGYGKPLIIKSLEQINRVLSREKVEEVSQNQIKQMWHRFDLWLRLPSSMQNNTTFV